jgi:hypothetical protein
MNTTIKGLSALAVLASGLALAQQPGRLNEVPPPHPRVLIPPPPYLLDSSVTSDSDGLMRPNEGLGSPGMNLFQFVADEYFPPVFLSPELRSEPDLEPPYGSCAYHPGCTWTPGLTQGIPGSCGASSK